MTNLRPSASDRLTLVVLATFVLGALVTGAWSIRLIAPFAVVAVAILLLAAWGGTSRTGRIIHDLSPAIWTPALFDLVGPLIERVNTSRWDHLLASADARMFGGLASAWREVLGRPAWLTDLASLAYVSFYFVPIGLALVLYFRGQQNAYERFVFKVQVAFYLSYFCYFAFPAHGPRVAVEQESTVIGGGAISAAVRAFLRIVELNVLDAFPSGHAAVCAIVLALGWRIFPRWRAPLVLAIGAIIFSTVYLSLHYVVDLVAGAFLALFVPAIAAPIGRVCGLAPLGATNLHHATGA